MSTLGKAEENHDLFINGPVNVIRLQNNNKTLDVYMDFHKNIQDKCEEGIDIDKYLTKSFKNIKGKKIYDFFLEINLSDAISQIADTRKKYIHDVMRMFTNIFIYDSVSNKIVLSKEFPNLRVHYIDIRNYIPQKQYIPKLYNSFNKLTPNDVTKSFLEKFMQDMSSLKKIDSIMYDMIYRNVTDFDMIYQNVTDFDMNLVKIINKIRTKYTNQTIGSKINTIIDSDLKSYFEKYFTSLDTLIEYLESTIHNYDNDNNSFFEKKISKYLLILYSICEKYEYVLEYRVKILMFLMDIFFLRRFLDKDYTTSSIVYTGFAHSNNYIYYLVKYFGFKITHAYYIKGIISEVNKMIEELDDPDKLKKYISPPKKYQCINLKDFPKII